MSVRKSPEPVVESVAGPAAIILAPPSSPWSPDNPNVPNVVPDPPAANVAELERVEEDTLIERPDLGEGAHTLIVAGDEIPAALAGYHRKPAKQ